MNYRVERQLTVAIENQPGRLATVAEHLAEHVINIKDLSIIDTIEQGVIRLVTSDPILAKKLFVKQGLYCLEADVLCVDLTDTPGTLAALSRALAAAQVNIDYAYGSGGTLKSSRIACYPRGKSRRGASAPTAEINHVTVQGDYLTEFSYCTFSPVSSKLASWRCLVAASAWPFSPSLMAALICSAAFSMNGSELTLSPSRAWVSASFACCTSAVAFPCWPSVIPA